MQFKIHSGRGPEFITGEELETYILYRRNESELAPKTLNLCIVIPPERLLHFKYRRQKIKKREPISIYSVCFFYSPPPG